MLAWHLLSLDAPTVAAVWCVYLAHALQISLPSASPYFLALGTWWIYVADRLLDGRGVAPSSLDTVPSRNGPLRERHIFYIRHRVPFQAALGLVTILLLLAAFTVVPTRLVIRDLALCTLGAGYFLIVHSTQSSGPLAHIKRIFPKELAVGIFFSIATFLPLTLQLESFISLVHHPEIPVAAAAFAALCWLNCAAIQQWEDATPNSWRISAAAALLAIASGAAIHLSFGPNFLNRLQAVSAAVCLSSIALFLLSCYRRLFTRQILRISADAALLTPLLYILLVSSID